MSEIKLDFAKQDGLVPVIVTDYQTGQVLMLAYMNEEAYHLTLETKQMHYWSRSRQEIWHKGATSGHYQYVKINQKRIATVIPYWSLLSKRALLVIRALTAVFSMTFL